MAERKTLADKARIKEREAARERRERIAGRKARALTAGLAAAVAVAGICLCVAGFRMYQYRASAAAYERALELAAIPELDALVAYQAAREQDSVPVAPGGAPVVDLPNGEAGDGGFGWASLRSEPDGYADKLAMTDLAALRAVNPDVAGWIDVPGTRLSYPFMKCGDASTYLRTAWDGSAATAGSIFMEPGCDPGLGGFNTILYGHNMLDGSMFGTLAEYRDHDWWSGHQTLYLVADGGVFRYRVYSVRMAGLTDSAFVYGEPDAAQQDAMVSDGLELSEIYTGVNVGAGSRILTLSTCTGLNRYDVRLVVQAVLEWHRSY